MSTFSRSRIAQAWQLLTGRDDGVQSSDDEGDTYPYPGEKARQSSPNAWYSYDSISSSSDESSSFELPLSSSPDRVPNVHDLQQHGHNTIRSAYPAAYRPSLSSSSSSSGYSDAEGTEDASGASGRPAPFNKVVSQGLLANPNHATVIDSVKAPSCAAIPSMETSAQDTPSQPCTPAAGTYDSPLHAAKAAGAHSYTQSFLNSESHLNQGGSDTRSTASGAGSEAAGVSTPTYRPGPHPLAADHEYYHVVQQHGQLPQDTVPHVVPTQQLLELQAALQEEQCESEWLRRWLAEEQVDSQRAQQECDRLSQQVEMLTEQLNNERHELKEVRGALSEVQQDRLRAQQQLTQAQAELEALQAQLAVQQPMLDTQSDCNNQQIPAPVMPSVPLPSVAALNGSLAAAQASVEEVIALRQALQDSEAERQQLALQVHELQRIVGQHSMDMEMLSSRADRLDKDEGALNEQLRSLQEQYQDQVESYCLELQHMEQKYSQLWEEHTQLHTTCDLLKAQLSYAQLALEAAQVAAADPPPLPGVPDRQTPASRHSAALPSLSPVSASHVAHLPPNQTTTLHAYASAAGSGAQTPPPRAASASSSTSAWGQLGALSAAAVTDQLLPAGLQSGTAGVTGTAPPASTRSSDSLEALLLQVAAKVLPKSSDEGFKSVLAAAANSAAITLASSGHLGHSLQESVELGALARSGNLFSPAGLQASLPSQPQQVLSSTTQATQAGVPLQGPSAGGSAVSAAAPGIGVPSSSGPQAASALLKQPGVFEPPCNSKQQGPQTQLIPLVIPAAAASASTAQAVSLFAAPAPEPGHASLRLSDTYEDVQVPVSAATIQGYLRAGSEARFAQDNTLRACLGPRLAGLHDGSQQEEDADEVLEEEGMLSSGVPGTSSLESPLFSADLLKRPPPPWADASPEDVDWLEEAAKAPEQPAPAAAARAAGPDKGIGDQVQVGLNPHQRDGGLPAPAPELPIPPVFGLSRPEAGVASHNARELHSSQGHMSGVQSDEGQVKAGRDCGHPAARQQEVSVSLDTSWELDAPLSSYSGVHPLAQPEVDSSNGDGNTGGRSNSSSSTGSEHARIGCNLSRDSSSFDSPEEPAPLVPCTPAPLDFGTPTMARIITHGRRQTMPPS